MKWLLIGLGFLFTAPALAAENMLPGILAAAVVLLLLLAVAGYYILRLKRSKTALQRQLTQLHSKQQSTFLFDETSGFPNKFQLQQTLNPLLHKPGSKGSLLLLKIRNFEQINKMLGRQHANIVLTQIAQRINQQLSAVPDVLVLQQQPVQRKLAHLGGVEFAIWLNESGKQHLVAMLARQIEQQIPEPLLLHGCPVTYRISTGIVHYPEHGGDLNQLIANAHIALEQYTEQRSESAVFDNQMLQWNSEKLVLMTQLQQALTLGQLQLDIQPQIEFSSRQVVAAEVLLRWQHPERGLLAPKDFLPLAEEMGMIYPLTCWVLQQAVAMLAELKKQGQQIKLAVNIASRDLFQVELAEQLEQMLVKADVAPNQLILELKEDALMAQPEESLQVLLRLRQLGVELALDDFGTGYSSVGFLRQLPIQQVKIDCQFVSGMHRSDAQAAVTGAIIDMAKNLQMLVVAEGVEEQAVADKLLRMGCQRGQGFLYSRPFALHGFPSWLKQHQLNPTPTNIPGYS